MVAIAGDPAPVEHDEVRWLGAVELGEVDWLEPDRPFLAELVGAPLRLTGGAVGSRVEGARRRE